MKPITAKALFKDLWPAAPAGVQITSVVTDSRAAGPGGVFVAIEGQRVDGHDFAAQAFEQGAAFVVGRRPMPGVPLDKTVLVGDVLDAMIEMGGNYREMFSPLVVGVTGSVGKTTTKDFCAAVFSAFGDTLKTEGNQNNEIGMPNTLFRLTDDTRYAVIEMGMQRLGEIRKLTRAARPHGGVISRISEVHIETVGSLENILRAKMEICAGLPDGAPLVLNGDDAMLRRASVPENVRAVYAGLEHEDNAVRARDIRRDGLGQQFTIRDAQFGDHQVYIPALGRHNVANALLAYTAATRLGLNADQSAAALERYTPTGMRQNIAERGGVTWIEDCYNAAPASMAAALSILGEVAAGRRIAVLGDMLELGEISRRVHTELGDAAADAGVDLLLTVGEQAQLAAQQAQKRGVPAQAFTQNADAAKELRQLLQKGDTVLVKASRGMHFEEILESAGARAEE